MFKAEGIGKIGKVKMENQKSIVFVAGSYIWTT